MDSEHPIPICDCRRREKEKSSLNVLICCSSPNQAEPASTSVKLVSFMEVLGVCKTQCSSESVCV